MTQSHWILIAFALWVVLIIGVTIYAKKNRKRMKGGGGVGNALMEFQSLLEPDKKIIIEMQREEESQEKEDGAPEKTVGEE